MSCSWLCTMSARVLPTSQVSMMNCWPLMDLQHTAAPRDASGASESKQCCMGLACNAAQLSLYCLCCMLLYEAYTATAHVAVCCKPVLEVSKAKETHRAPVTYLSCVPDINAAWTSTLYCRCGSVAKLLRTQEASICFPSSGS